MNKIDDLLIVAENGCAASLLEILGNTDIDPSMNNDLALILAVDNNNLEIVKILLKDDRVNPSSSENKAIRMANAHKNNDIVKLLWNKKDVRDKLKSKHKYIYKSLLKKQVIRNINNF